MTKHCKVAVVGASGAVGREMLRVLEERDFPVAKLRLLASQRSAGIYLPFKGEKLLVQKLTYDSFKGMDIALFSAGSGVSARFAPLAAESGCVVIDNTSCFRMENDIPLVVPEVNPGAIANYCHRGIIANPNCTTIQMVVALKPLHDRAGLKRVVVTTFQAVSGAGQKAITEMQKQSGVLCRQWFQEGRPEVEQVPEEGQPESATRVFPHQIVGNCLPHIGDFNVEGYSAEEMKMVNETRKILDCPNLKVCATTVRVPVVRGHSEVVNLEFEQEITPSQARDILQSSPGVRVMDEVGAGIYPTALDAAGQDAVLVGRIRSDISCSRGLVLWVVADNLRKGAASNAVQIAEIVAEQYL